MPPDNLRPGLYVHVPFCSGKCRYCDFFSAAAPGLVRPWLKGLKREVGFYRGFGPFDTLYFGGGTPSCLAESDLSYLFDIIFSSFEFLPEAEITIEVNPEDVGPAQAGFIMNLGVNRISLGFQSPDPARLEFLGRRHSADQAFRAVDHFRQAGCLNLGLDLIFGLPGQGVDEWRAVLDQVLPLAPEHLSCYQLTIEDRTYFGRLAKEGLLTPPDEETSRALFLASSEYLEERGYVQYEVSNFARGNDFRSRHNRKYWLGAPYLGLGPSAHSFRDGTRWWNVRSIRKYVDNLATGRPPVEEREILTLEQKKLEAILLGLRNSEGVALTDLSTSPRAVRELTRALGQGLVSLRAGRVIPSRTGLVTADRLAELLSD
ncbi:MAG: radical SAM family heme chaperone HemW [Pseudomonadota bacterium]